VTAPLHEVVLRNLPLPLVAAGQQRHDDLMREFALIAGSGDAVLDRIPIRLVELSAQMQERYAAFTSSTQSAIAEATRRGDETMDVVFHLPASARPEAAELAQLLDEADSYCHQGALLTMAAPPELVALRRWYLGELVRQIGGDEPRPWTGPTRLPDEEPLGA
jgi:hypothetical protein